VTFAIVWLGSQVPIVLFFRQLHVSTAIICFLLTPSVFFGIMMVVRPLAFCDKATQSIYSSQ
jgi:hypothetical protein